MLRENNWMTTSEMPRSPEHGETGDVGTYLRQLAAENSDELMRELDDALSEVRDLSVKNSELTKVNGKRRRTMLRARTGVGRSHRHRSMTRRQTSCACV